MKSPETAKEVRVLAIIPARGGSRGIPKKNITDLLGKPLIHYSIREAHAAKKVDATIVSTDDPEIAEVSRNLGADVPFLRPADFATDTSRDIDFLQHALDWVERERGWKPDIVLFLPPTSPSRTGQDIDAAVALLDASGADSVRTMVHPSHWNPHKMWRSVGTEGQTQPLFEAARGNVPRQELARHYMPVAIAYAVRASNIRKGDLWGPDVRVLEIPLERFAEFRFLPCIPGFFTRLFSVNDQLHTLLGALSRKATPSSTHYMLQTIQITGGRILDGIYATRVSPDGKYLIVGNRGYNVIAVYDRKTFRKVYEKVLPHRRKVTGVGYNHYHLTNRFLGLHLGVHHSELLAR